MSEFLLADEKTWIPAFVLLLKFATFGKNFPFLGIMQSEGFELGGLCMPSSNDYMLRTELEGYTVFVD